MQDWWQYLTWPWRITLAYLTIMLLVPTLALVLKASTVGSPQKFWQIATAPIALSAYEVNIVTALWAAVANSLLGTLLAWVLVRYDFPGKRFIDAAVDLPFAIPTAVAGLTLATIYGPDGWVGGLLEPLGIKIAYTRLGVWLAMTYVSLPFAVRTVQPVLAEIEPSIEEASWSLGASDRQTF
jgi:sulfate transport system permease protein